MKVKHGTFYKNMFWQYGLQILKYLFPLVLVPYLTRVLGTDGYAIYAYVLSFMGMMQTIADFGFTLSGTKEIISNKSDDEKLSRVVCEITAARVLLILGLGLFLGIVARFIPLLGANLNYAFVAYIAVSLRALLPDYVFQGFESMGSLTTRYFASKGTTVVLTLLLVKSEEDLLLVAVADALGAAIGLIWSYLAIRKLFDMTFYAPSLKGSLYELRESALYCVSNVSSSLFSGFTTIIIGLALSNSEEIAYWSLTLTTVNAVQALYTPISNSLYPHMLNSGDFKFAKKLALLALPALLIGTAAYCYLAEPIMFVLGGPEYGGGAQVMRDIAPVLVFSFYAILIGWPVLGAMGYVKELTSSTIFTGIVNVVVLSLLYIFGYASLKNICLVRWLADALLFIARGFVLNKVLNHNRKQLKE